MRQRLFVLLAIACAACNGTGGTAATTPDASLEVDAGVVANADGGTGTEDGGSPTLDAGAPDAGPPDAGVDPADLAPHPWPEVTGGATHDVDAVLDRVLERDALAGACAAVRGGATDRATRLRCGKAMFFDETFGTIGIPYKLLVFLQKYYASTFYGMGFSRMGFVADPQDRDGLPIGLRPTTGRLGTIETRAFTCASCHFGQLPDGRYAVGYGNLELDYGNFLATLGAIFSLSFNQNDPDVHPELKTRLAAPIAAAKMQPLYTIEAGILGLELIGAANAAPNLTLEEQGRFLHLKSGTMDFLTKPLVEDGVWTVSRILSLWNIPDADQRASAGMNHELLSWTGGVKTLIAFLRGFAAVGASSASSWTDAELSPLADYIRSLRAPRFLEPGDRAEIRDGARLFVTKGCKGCHAGPSGEGTRPFTFDEIGTDTEMRKIFNPTPDGELCCGIERGDSYDITGGIKAPRFGAVALQSRFLHNGSVGSLRELFCLTPRDPTSLLAQTSGGHRMTCEGLTDPEKRALITYLRSL